jgi:hypothetical protein
MSLTLNQKTLNKRQRLKAYIDAKEKIENISHLDGLCWTLGKSLLVKGVHVLSGEHMCHLICDYFPEFSLFKPEKKVLWWFDFPTTQMNKARLQRLIVLDFCIAMLS